MALDLNSTTNEIRIHDRRNPDQPSSLFARDASAREQLSFARESLESKRGQISLNTIRRARLKWGCLVLERAQEAPTADAAGYGFTRNGQWVPLNPGLTADQVAVTAAQVQAEYAALHGAAWAAWIATLPPWKLFLLARAPLHLETVAQIIFDGVGEAAGPGPEGNGEGGDEDQEGAGAPS